MRAWLGCFALCCWLGCGRELGPPRKAPLPAPSGRTALLGNTPRSARIANYEIVARYDATAHTIAADMTLTWTNTGKTAVDMLPFHLYLNAFKDKNSLFSKESRGQLRNDTRANDASAIGAITVARLTVDGTDLTSQMRMPGPDADTTVMEVPLPVALAPGAVATIKASFTAQLPRVFARSGYEGEFTLAGQWFPKIGVRHSPSGNGGDERWICDPYHAFSEFFADFGTYDVQLTLPQTHVVAATGVLVRAVDNVDGTRTHTYRAEDVHDFAWMADPYMLAIHGVARVQGGAVDVAVFYRPAQRHFAARHLAAAIGAIEQFSELFTPYPWSSMAVIDPPLDASGASGMEYPTLVVTAADHALWRPGIRAPETVTVHEVGHNWFQGMLASNEGAEPWLDEGVNEWADAVVMARLFGEGRDILDLGHLQLASTRAWAALGEFADTPVPIATAAADFPDGGSYGSVAYIKSHLALATLQNLVGADAFFAGMKRYASTWAFRHPTADSLRVALEAEVGNLDWIWPQLLHGLGGVRLEVVPAYPVCSGSASVGYECEFTVTSTGHIHAPVEIVARFTDGGSENLLWDNRSQQTWKKFRLTRSTPLAEVELDPEHKVLLLTNPTERVRRFTPSGAASRRAGARVMYWAQLFMGSVGL